MGRLASALALTAAVPGVLGAAPWPLPSSYSEGTTVLAISDSFTLLPVDGATPSFILQAALERYQALILDGHECSGATRGRRSRKGSKGGLRRGGARAATGEIASCTVEVQDDSATGLAEGMDESYDLAIGEDGSCSITSQTTWGALQGLETLSHLAGEACAVENAPVAISDAPRFSFRGLMVDTARHFLPVEFLKHVVDGMKAVKLNVMHWHVVDSESFPAGSKRYPELAEEGAYRFPEAAYSTDDMQAIVEYARERGIRVMPEFDVPGHGSWGAGMPSVMVQDGPCSDTLDPTNPDVYTFLVNFLSEMGTYFTDNYLFLGGDEVQSKCFLGSPSVTAWMNTNNMTTSAELQSYFWQQVTAQVMPQLNRTLGVWIADDGIPYPQDLPAGSFGNVWESQSMMPSVIDRGARVVLSGPWYLDQQKPGNYITYALQNLWKGMYNVEPLSNLTEEQAENVLGGQACMWAEGINRFDFDQYAWTKTAAVAERLWSPASVRDQTYASNRLVEMVCRFNMRGFGAEAILPSFCPTDL